MTWYAAAILCGALVLFGVMGSRVWLPHNVPAQWTLPAVLLGLLAGGAVALVEPGWTEGFRAIALFALLSAVAVVNLATQLIPNQFVLAGLVLGVLPLWKMPEQIFPSLLAAVICFGGLLTIALLFPGGLGMGVVKLGAVVGLFLGMPAGPLALLLFFGIGALAAAVLLLTGRVSRHDELPVLPFLGPAGLLQWFMTRLGWVDPLLEALVAGGVLLLLLLINWLTRNRGSVVS